MPREIESLHGIVKATRHEEPPHGIFVMCGADPARWEETEEGKIPVVNLDLEMFVRTSVLSKDLQDKIREEVKALPKVELTHPDTIAELQQNEDSSSD
jgi:hypothetical protein